MVFYTLFLALPTACQHNAPANGTSSDGKSPLTATYQQSAPDQPPVHRLDWKADSFLAFRLGENMSFYQQGFIFSPFEKDKVWFAPENGEGFELDLKSGQKTPFSEKFGHPFFQKALRADGIRPDSFDKNVCWFLNFQEGIFRFDRSNGQGQFFDIAAQRRAMTAIAFSKNDVWIGTSSGVWVYDRRAGTCRAVDYSPEIWIYQLRMAADGKLWINENYTYDSEAKCWEKLPDPNPNPMRVHPGPTITLIRNYLGGDYVTADSPDELWHCNQAYWISCRKTDSLVQTFRAPVTTTRVLSLSADSDHLYLLCRDTFLIVNKAYLFDNYAGDPALLPKIKRLTSLADSLQLYQPELWPDRKSKMDFLKSQFPGEADPYLLAQLQQFARNITLPADERSLRTLLLDGRMDTLVSYSAYSALVLQYVTGGELRKVLALAEECRNKRSDLYFFKHSGHTLDVVKTSVHQLDSLDQTNQPEYERLWAKGKAMEWFCVNQTFRTANVCYSYWLADSIYQRLVRLYPQSPRADDAAFELIGHSLCYEGEDGSAHPEEVQAWRKYLRKYPDTERRAEVLCSMAWALGREAPDLRQGLQWLAEAERLRPGLFLESNRNNQSEVKADFQRQLDWLELAVSLQLKKSSVRPGEPVEVIFSIKNTAATLKKLSIFPHPGVPNFTLDILPEEAGETCVRPTTYIEAQPLTYAKTPTASKIKYLHTGKTYVERWDLTKTAHKLNNPNLGRFVFDRPGVYVITARWGLFGDGKMAAPVRLRVE